MKSGDTREYASGPPASVLIAFQISQKPVRLSGGQGQTWSAGGVVLKRTDDEAEATWLADFANRVLQRGFRIALPIAARDGRWVVDGWTAWTRLEGEHSTTRWAELLEAGSAFHAATRSVPKPEFIERRGWSMRTLRDRWAVADRIAWGEVPAGDLVEVMHVERLLEARRTVDLPSQLVHGDLSGNVLFAEGMPPAIIDFSGSLYWRPVGYSAAIAVADALSWHGAPEETIRLLESFAEWPQLLLHAVLFRVFVDGIAGRVSRSDDSEGYARLFPLVLDALGSR